jgi:hypothetical protein
VTPLSSSSGRFHDRGRHRERSVRGRPSIGKLRLVGGIAVTLALLTLFFGLGVKCGTTTSLPAAGAEPPRVPTDDRGFINSAARCEGTNTAIAIGRTQRSLVVICPEQNGKYEYRGVRVSDGADLTVAAETTVEHAFLAENDGVTYAVSPTQLLVTAGETVINREPMIEYRVPGALPAEAGGSGNAPPTAVQSTDTSGPAP